MNLQQSLLGVLVSFATVFFRVTQQQNVIHNRKVWAAFTSYAIAAMDIALVGLVVANGWYLVFPVGTGSALGVTLSMYLHPKFLRSANKHGNRSS